jgi:MSHA pilin protein MshA
MKQKQLGFTLIELIIVIVVLGILSATAAPKFIGLQSDAKASAVKAVEGAVNSVSSVIHGKALIASQTAATGTAMINSVSTNLVFGYLAPTADLASLLDISPDMKPIAEVGTTGAGAVAIPAINTYVIRFYDFDDKAFNYLLTTAAPGCLIVYTAATSTTPPTVESFTDGC